MSKIKRVLFGSVLLLVAGLGVVVLTTVGSGIEGPLGRLLGVMGSAVARTESQVAFHLRGPGRAGELLWLNDIRHHRERLADPDRMLTGAYDNWLPATFEGLTRLESSLGEPLAIVHLFTAWGEQPEHRFPRRVARTIWNVGSVPLITWEPWLTTFDAGRHSHLPSVEERDRGGLVAIARGDYDFFLQSWFRDAAEFGQPMFLRFGHEMNDAYRYPWGPHNNRPDEYIAAFRHVVDTARKAGAWNILWVWSPHIAYDDFDQYFPGDDVVDWVGTTVLNYGTVAYWSDWWTFDDIFTRKYDRLAAYGKPIMIAEFGTLMAGGERAPWFEQALTRLTQRLPRIKAVVFFHNRSDATITYQALNWAFDEDKPVIAAIKRGMGTWDDRSHTAGGSTAQGF
jgi:hypothetical protein